MNRPPRPPSPLNDLGFPGFTLGQAISRRHDLNPVWGCTSSRAPCHGQNPCQCICTICQHRWKLGDDDDREAYRVAQIDGRLDGDPEFCDPPRRIFTLRFVYVPPPMPQPRRKLGNLLQKLASETLDSISAFVGEFQIGAAGLRGRPAIGGPAQAHHHLTFAVGQRPCTEGYSNTHHFGGASRQWDLTLRCPNDRHGAALPYQGQIHVCKEHDCLTNRRAVPHPGNTLTRGLDADTPGSRAWVCQDHIDGAKTEWRLHDRTDFDKSHRVPPCTFHEKQLMRDHPRGINTCTCSRVSFDSWQCRACFEAKISKMTEAFQIRVDLPFRGDADIQITGDRHWDDWRIVRRMLARDHPCLHSQNLQDCKVKRLGGIYRKRVLDCRCCGGVIVEPQAEPSNRKLRSMRGEGEKGTGGEQGVGSSAHPNKRAALVQLDDQGRAKYQKTKR